MKDELFLRGEKVPMTKEAVRALALSKLDLHHARHFIDVGAGTGSVSIEAALHFPALKVTAIERNPAALALMAQNCRHFACENIVRVQADAPVVVEEKADAIFIGGSGGNLASLIDWALEQLHPEGRLVMTFILQENLTRALAHLQQRGIAPLDCQQIQVSALSPLGSGHYFKANNPVYVIACQKEEAHV
ncbi:precorrin-6Y C5,15-methyltransferase (decarboxylating), CbiT subunit [Enterobacteriaceae bacterium strain FGI 57]|nr:precorrin-6Y C5,15-methyltransferase (decarboxylating), CbiT subunit [Enterobacteriaceae bacterium strain FGI 57]